MTIAVEFKNKYIIHPGATVNVDVSGMVQGGVDQRKIAAIIAEAPWGEPGVIHVFGDSNEARNVAGPSVAADLVQLLMRPSTQNDIDGAELVYWYKPNRSTRAIRYLLRDPNRPTVVRTTFTVQAATARSTATDPITPATVTIPGNFTQNTFAGIIVEVIGGTGKGQQRAVQSSVDSGGNHVLSLIDAQDWAILPTGAGGAISTVRIGVPMLTLISTLWGTPGNDDEIEFGRQWNQESWEFQARRRGRIITQKQPLGGLRTPRMHIKFDPTGGGALSQWTDFNNWVIPRTLEAANPVQGTTTTLDQTTLTGADTNLVSATITADKWILITGPTANNPFLGKLYKAISNTITGGGAGGADQVVLAYPGLGSVPAVNLDWKCIELGDSYLEIDGENAEAKTLKIINRIWDPNAGPAAFVTETYASIDLTQNPTLDDVVKAMNEFDGVTASLGDGVKGDTLSKEFDFGQMSTHHGRDQRTTLTGAEAAGSTALDCERTDHMPTTGGGETWKARISPGMSIEEEVIVSANTTATDILTTTALKNAHPANSVVEFIRGSNLVKGPTEITDKGFGVKSDLQFLINFITANAGSFTAQRPDADGSTAVPVVGAPSYKSQIGGGVPEDCLDIWKPMWGGSPGNSIVAKPTNTSLPDYPVSWEHGFDQLLLQKDIRVIVPGASVDASNWSAGDIEQVYNLLDTHLLDADDDRAERHGYMGISYPLEPGTFKGVTYAKGLLDLIREKNNPRLSLSGQMSKFNSESRNTEITADEWAFSAKVAGIHLGTPIGEPATLKFLRTNALSQRHNDWDPLNRRDLKKALEGRLLYGEPYRARWRVVRHFSTHIEDENLALTDANVFDVRNELKRASRERMEERFGGRGIGVQRPGIRQSGVASVPNIREAMSNLLEEEWRKEGLIVDSQVEGTEEWIHAWHSLRVTITGDVCRIIVAVFPKTGLNFILIDFTFQIPRQSG